MKIHCTAVRFRFKIAVVDDRGFFLTLQAVRRQLGAMPSELYLIRLIHHHTRRAMPGERLWTARELGSPAIVRFLRARNREGCEVYLQPFAGDRNAGYILVDLDQAAPAVVTAMRADGYGPCVVAQTSPGHLQAWVHLSTSPLEPAVASAAGRLLARAYGGDPASTDWRHLGRLAGFTNQKPARRTRRCFAPWVKLVYAAAGLAPQSQALLQSARESASSPPPPISAPHTSVPDAVPTIAAAEALNIYQACLERWRVRERFPQPDWSIVDLWVARHLLSRDTPPARVQDILRLASPQFPRRHGDPADYLRRTLARAGGPSLPRPVCTAHDSASAPEAAASACSNSTGER
ncbi:MAG: hypothetical protein KIT09_16800 [Bryobacteraceae bacterium]|nr:hypothetical protein [Bryobacteraceae bacterium]